MSLWSWIVGKSQLTINDEQIKINARQIAINDNQIKINDLVDSRLKALEEAR